MKIIVEIRVIAESKEDHDLTTELVDDLWSLEQVVFDEYGTDNEINFSVDEKEKE